MFNIKDKVQDYKENKERQRAKDKKDLAFKNVLKEYKRMYNNGEVGVKEDLPYETFKEYLEREGRNWYVKDYEEFKEDKYKNITTAYIKKYKEFVDESEEGKYPKDVYKKIIFNKYWYTLQDRVKSGEKFTMNEFIKEIDKDIEKELGKIGEYTDRIKEEVDNFFVEIRNSIDNSGGHYTKEEIDKKLEEVKLLTYNKTLDIMNVDEDKVKEHGLNNRYKEYLREVVQIMYRRAVMYFYIKENKEEYEKSTYPYRIDLEDFYKKTFKVKVGKYGEPYDDINIRIAQILHEKNNSQDYRYKDWIALEFPKIEDFELREWKLRLENYVNNYYNDYVADKVSSGEYVYGRSGDNRNKYSRWM